MQSTSHTVLNQRSQSLGAIPDGSISLVVTSPPYPMIEMWDHIMGEQNPDVTKHLEEGNAMEAFEAMHLVLDEIWEEVDRKVAQSGFVCINIGDATRTINGQFQLFSNHSRIIRKFSAMGYSVLPDIIWRKTTNAPNKFMGSGMLPAGAYVTYEHEYVLIFRKGGKRTFKKDELSARQESAFFWEERNKWFSDLWDFQGAGQKLKNPLGKRERSGAFPFELAYRLINMYSVKGDTVLDPFLGTGTSLFAAMCAERNSYGVEMDPHLAEAIPESALQLKEQLNQVVSERIRQHAEFVEIEKSIGKEFKYESEYLKLPVKTRQEQKIKFSHIDEISREDNRVTVRYQELDLSQQIHQLNLFSSYK